jgi:hypothetical protein
MLSDKFLSNNMESVNKLSDETMHSDVTTKLSDKMLSDKILSDFIHYRHLSPCFRITGYPKTAYSLQTQTVSVTCSNPALLR